MKHDQAVSRILIIISLVIILPSIAKTDIRDIDVIERLLDAEMEGEEADYAFSIIEYYNYNKIPLLTASPEEISILPTINRLKANAIKSFLKKNPDARMSELINAIDLNELQTAVIALCTQIALGEKGESQKNDYLNIKITADKPLQDAKGFTDNKFEGTNYGLNNKLYSSIANTQFGLSSDKDIGEKLIIDHYAFYLHKQFSGHRITLGNFKLMSGSGLILGNSFSSSKFSGIAYSNGEITNNIQPDLSPYNSKSFRGAAYQGDIEINNNNLFTVSAWASNMNRAANLNDNNEITSLYTSNLFRTETETTKKDDLQENVFGGSLQYKNSQFTIIYTAFNVNYNHNTSGTSGGIINNESGFLQSIALQFNTDSLMLAGEIAKYQSSIATQANLKYYMSKTIVSINMRYFSEDFRSPFGTNLYESSYPSNEIGAGIGISHKISKKINIEAVADYFESINRTYFNYLPIKGIDYEIRSEIKINTNHKFYIRLKYDNKDEQSTLANKEKSIEKNSAYRARLDYEVRYSAILRQKFRSEVAIATENPHRDESIGYLFSTELIYKPIPFLEIKPAIAIYNSDTYDSAIWLLNTFANSSMQIKPLYEKGIFAKINIAFRPIDELSLFVQYSVNYKPDINSIGSGYTMINKNTDQQLRFNLSVNL